MLLNIVLDVTRNTNMDILITGGNGFVARNMLSYFRNTHKDWNVEDWSWTSDKTEWPKVSCFEWVIHLGAVTDPTETDVELVLTRNLDFSKWLFSECQEHGTNLQYASTADVYGNTKDFSEYGRCYPETPYAWSKYLFDRWVFKQPHSAFVQGFRYFDVYGKWMHTKGNNAPLLYKWRQEAKDTGVITIPTNAKHIKRDWVWVGDVCRVHLDFIEQVHGSGLWNVGSGLNHTVLDIAEEIAEQEDAELKFSDDIKLYNSYANLSHLKETVGKRKWLNVYEWLDTE